MRDQDAGHTKRCRASDQAGVGCQRALGPKDATPADTGGAECCAPAASGAQCCAPAVGSSGRLRLLVFLVVMAAAAAVLAHALTRKAEPMATGTGTLAAARSRAAEADNFAAADPASHAGKAGKVTALAPVGKQADRLSGARRSLSVPERPSKTPAEEQLPAKADGFAADDPASRAGEAGKAASAGSAETADPPTSLGPVAAGKEAVFVLLPGDDRRATEAAAKVVKAAIKKIKARGRRVAALTLERGNPEYARLVGRLSITEFPSVIAQGQGCGETVVTGEITEAKLFQAFVVASQPPSSCGTAGTCGPSGCR